jgi:hypothetical protein
MVKGVAHVAGPRRQGSEQRRQRAPHLAEVLQKPSVKRFTATSCNGLGTPGEGCRAGEALGLRHEDIAAAEREVSIVARENANGARAKSGGRTVSAGGELIRLYADYLHEEYGGIGSDYVLSGCRDNTYCPEPGVIWTLCPGMCF